MTESAERPLLTEAEEFAGATHQTVEEADDGALFFLTCLYLIAPAILVLCTFSTRPAAIAVAVAAGWFFYLLARRTDKSKLAQALSPATTWPYLVLAATGAWLTGALPPIAENNDWEKHYAVLNALIDNSWPPVIVTGDAIGTLRYSLGFYVFPAVAAKIFGPWITGAAVWVWTTLGVYLALTIGLGTKSRTTSTAFLLGCVFLLFSGADIVGMYIRNHSSLRTEPEASGPDKRSAAEDLIHIKRTIQPPPLHLEWWARFGELSSGITNLLWAPQHTIGAWIGTFLLLRFPRRSMQHVGILVAAAAIWSPFAALGMIPVIGWCLTKVRPRDVFSLSNVSSAPVVLLAAAYFLTRSSGGIPAYAIWTEHGFTWSVWAIFIVLEFGALIGAMLFLSRSDAYLLAVMGGFLVLLTLFNVGAFNDLLMRGSIPALGVLALAAANRIAGTPNTGAKTPLIVLLVIGLVTPTGEIMRGLTEKRMTGQRQCTIEQMVAAHKFLTPQYVAFDRELSGMQVEPVLDVLQLPLHRFGIASFDDQSRRIESAEFADAAFVTDEITLPAGIYKLEAVVDWDITAEKPGKNGGHISRHADRILIPLQTSRAAGGRLASYFRSDLKPFRLSFGLGGWAKGKGFLQVKEWKISSVKQKGT